MCSSGYLCVTGHRMLAFLMPKAFGLIWAPYVLAKLKEY